MNSGRRLWCVLLLVVSLFLSGLTPAFAAWTAPVELNSIEDSNFIEDRSFPANATSAVQKNGAVHVTYIDKSGKTYSIIHLTNKTGSWQKETIQSSTKRLSAPAIAFRKGRLHLAWARGAGRGSEIVYATNAAGAWSFARVTDNSVADLNPVVAVRRGKVYVAWIQAEGIAGDGSAKNGAILVKSNASGRWRIDKVAETQFSVGVPAIKVGGDGAAHIVYAGRNKLDGISYIFHADNAAGRWRYEKLPANFDRDGNMVSAETPSLALSNGAVYIAFLRSPTDMSYAQIAMAVKKAGAWRFRGLTKKHSFMDVVLAPKIAVRDGRVELAYTKLAFTFEAFNCEIRYLELINGKLRGEAIDGESVAFDPLATELPPMTVFLMSGLEDVDGLIHAIYLRLTLEPTGENITSKLLYSRRDAD